MLTCTLPQINMPAQTSIDLGKSVQLAPAITGNIMLYHWSPATGLSNTSVPGPFADPQKTTTYQLTVTTGTGCQQSASITVNVLELIVVPNAFTPNGDEINDTWNIP